MSTNTAKTSSTAKWSLRKVDCDASGGAGGVASLSLGLLTSSIGSNLLHVIHIFRDFGWTPLRAESLNKRPPTWPFRVYSFSPHIGIPSYDSMNWWLILRSLPPP